MNHHCRGYIRQDNANMDKVFRQPLEYFLHRQTLDNCDNDCLQGLHVFLHASRPQDLEELPDTLLEQMAWALLSRPGYDILIQPLRVNFDNEINGLIPNLPPQYLEMLDSTGFVAVSKKKMSLNESDGILPKGDSNTLCFSRSVLNTDDVAPLSIVHRGSANEIARHLFNLVKKKFSASFKIRIKQILNGILLTAGKGDLVSSLPTDKFIAQQRNWGSARPVLTVQAAPQQIHDRIPILIAMHWLELGGAEKFAVDLIKQLPKDRYAVYVTTDVPSANTWRNEIIGHVEEVWDLPAILPDPLIKVFYKEYIKSRNIKLLHIHHGVKVYESVPYIRRFYPDLIILDSLHIIEMPPNPGGFPEYVGRDLSHLIDHHHVISDLLKQFLVQRWQVSESKVTRIYLNVDTDYFNPDKIEKNFVRSRFNIPEDAILIGFIGRFVEQKHPMVFLDVAKRIMDEFNRENSRQEVSFVMVGSGRLMKKMQRRIRQLGLQDCLILHAEVDDTRPVYNDLDLLLMPSENEGLALVTYESMAMKVPVLFSDVGGQSELLDDRFLVSSGTNEVKEFADKALSILKNREDLSRTGQELRNYILENHRASDTFKEIVDLYERLLTGDIYNGRHKDFCI